MRRGEQEFDLLRLERDARRLLLEDAGRARRVEIVVGAQQQRERLDAVILDQRAHGLPASLFERAAAWKRPRLRDRALAPRPASRPFPRAPRRDRPRRRCSLARRLGRSAFYLRRLAALALRYPAAVRGGAPPARRHGPRPGGRALFVRRRLAFLRSRAGARGLFIRPRRLGERAGRFGDARGQLVEVLPRREEDVAEGVGGEKFGEFARAHALDQRAVVRDAQEAAATDDGELLLGS